MSLFQYYHEDINTRIESINNYEYLFAFENKTPNLIESLYQMFISANANPYQIDDLINDILSKCKKRIDNKWYEIKTKYTNITKDEAYIICSYTCEALDKRYNPYSLLNENIVSENRQKGLRNVNKYFYLLLSSLRKLTIYYPKKDQHLFRCIRNVINLEKDPYNENMVPYQKGNTKTFWAFTSTSPTIEESLKFLRDYNSDSGTIFSLGGFLWGYDITLFNIYNENEILLEPERKFIIKDIKIMNDNLVYCYCEMLKSNPILDINFYEKIGINHLNLVQKINQEDNSINSENEEIAKYLVKIEKDIDDYNSEYGYGFICNIPSKKIKALITYDSIIDEDFLNNEEILIVHIRNDKKKINIKSPRYKQILKDLNITIIEIKNEDNIDYFIEIDENSDGIDYIGEYVIYIEFNENNKCQYFEDTIIKKNNNKYSLKSGKKLHKGLIISNKNSRILGIINNKIISINILVNKINFIISKFEVVNTLEEIRILNKGYFSNGYNFEIDNKIKVIIDGKIKKNIYEYKFKQKGINVIYYVSDDIIYNLSYMFDSCYHLKELDLSSFNTNDVIYMNNLFCYCKLIKEIDFSAFNTNNVRNMKGMFYGCTSLETLNLSSFKTNNVTDMADMFHDCKNLRKLYLSSFNTSNVYDMSWMFANCYSLEKLDLSSFNVEKVGDMSRMFLNCSSLKELFLSSFKTQCVTDMSYMFSNCSSLNELYLFSFNTKNVTKMSYMFFECHSLKVLNLSSFNTESVTDMSSMFDGCTKLKELNLSSFNTENVKNMSYMFSTCFSLEYLNLLNFKTDITTNITGMFSLIKKSFILNNNDKAIKEEFEESMGTKKSYCKLCDFDCIIF